MSFSDLLTFANIRGEISDLLNSSNNLSTDDIQLLKNLSENIRAFEHVQTRWFAADGSVANYWKSKILENKGELIEEDRKRFQNITQDKLINEAIESVHNGSYFTITMSDQLLLDIDSENGRYHHLAQRHPELFEHIKQYTEATKNRAEFILQRERQFSSNILTNHQYQLASQLQGRFIPSNQSFDPIRGRDIEGQCYGYLMSWRDEVSRSGKYLSLQRLNLSTFYHQYSQPFRQYSYTCRTVKNIPKVVDNMLSTIEKDGIYELGIRDSEGGHSMGLRKLPNGEIEFIDANYGLFVFPDEKKFSIWINQYLSSYLINKHDFKINFDKIGTQPEHSVATIPPVGDVHPVSMNLDNNKKNYEYNYFFITNSAINLSYQPEIAQLTGAQQYAATKNFESMIHNKIKQISTEYVINEVPLKEDIALQKRIKGRLDKKIFEKIDHEIKRLENITIGDASSKLNALKVYKERMAKRDVASTMDSISNQWLSEKPADSEKTYRQIIQEHRIGVSGKDTKTFEFISKLVSRYEINPFMMKLSRDNILEKTIEIILLKNASKENLSDTFKDINKILTENSSLDDKLIKIKKRCSENYTGFFARSLKGRDKQDDQFYNLIQKLDVSKHESLIETASRLNDIIKTTKKKYEDKPEIKPSH